MALRADERRDKLRKASGRSTYPMIRRYLNGETRQRKPLSACSESIAACGEPGVLFTFPSQYYALSVTKKYLALRGGPRSFRQGFSCLVLLWILLGDLGFRIRGFHSLRPDFPVRSPILRLPQRSPNPAMHASRFGLFPFRSPLLWKSINFLSLPPGT